VDVHHIHATSEHLVSTGANTTAEGIVAIPINENGQFMINVRADGFIRDEAFLNVTCDITSCASCAPVKLMSLSPKLQGGELRVMMNWDEKPSDLDVFSFQTNINDRSETCSTYYGNKKGCSGVTLDKDNDRGGTNGAETITFSNITENSNYVYMVYVKDFSRRSNEFAASNVHLTVTDGLSINKINMNNANYHNELFWFAGCMRIVGHSFEFVSANAFTNDPPKDIVPEHCVNLFGLNIDPIACFEDNINYPGNDMNNGHENKKNDAVQCREDCLRTDGCVGFAWNKETNDCWLKPTMIQGKKEDNLFISGLAVCEDPTAPPPEPKPETSVPWWKRIFG